MGSVVVGGLHYYIAFLLVAAPLLAASASSAPHVATGSAPDMKPAAAQELSSHMVALNHSARRMLGSFQVCALCTCCGGSRGLCLPSPCCYAINCNIPNRPFGFCSFSPMACNCLGCHL